MSEITEERHPLAVTWVLQSLGRLGATGAQCVQMPGCKFKPPGKMLVIRSPPNRLNADEVHIASGILPIINETKLICGRLVAADYSLAIIRSRSSQFAVTSALNGGWQDVVQNSKIRCQAEAARFVYLFIST